jgi:hypothetical protein
MQICHCEERSDEAIHQILVHATYGLLRCARNDDMENRSRGALMRPSFAHHHAIPKIVSPPATKQKGGEAPKGALSYQCPRSPRGCAS